MSFTVDTLLAADNEEDGNDAKHSIACVLACQNHQIAIKIFESKKQTLEKLVQQLKTPSSQALSKDRMTTIAKFWFNAASDEKVCARL